MTCHKVPAFGAGPKKGRAKKDKAGDGAAAGKPDEPPPEPPTAAPKGER